ncbi:hypothetical protein BDW74DRAFT_181752 [Aspergillus multicolor]|uniref:uncharacterized protein n=1 Tax=Aspergillus multicolor TaxID=41759 RepID=UPI003CCDDA28
MSFTIPETPRYLILKDPSVRPRGGTGHTPATRPRTGSITWTLKVWQNSQLLMIPINRYHLMLGFMSQQLGQWSGASAISIYAVGLFSALDKTGQSEKLFATCSLSVTSLAVCRYFAPDDFKRLEAGDLISTEKQAAVGAVAMMYISGVGWTMGWNSFQYLYGNTKAVPVMLLALQNFGPLESTDELFSLPWHTVGRYGNILAPDVNAFGATDDLEGAKKEDIEACEVEYSQRT